MLLPRIILAVAVAVACCAACSVKQPNPLPSSVMVYSTSVQDSFRIYTTLPETYNDTTKYPLIVLLDANAYQEPVVAEYKLGLLTQGWSEAIIVGVGYKDFMTLDSLRSRDYTYPGGADKFKKFIDNEIIPGTIARYKVDLKSVTLMGHSLGGYFVLYHMFESSGSRNPVTNYVAASPSLHYNTTYINEQLSKFIRSSSPVKFYTSIGTNEYEPAPAENQFPVFKKELDAFSVKTNSHIRADEYTNFNHLDAAIPGFMKGLYFVLVED